MVTLKILEEGILKQNYQEVRSQASSFTPNSPCTLTLVCVLSNQCFFGQFCDVAIVAIIIHEKI